MKAFKVVRALRIQDRPTVLPRDGRCSRRDQHPSPVLVDPRIKKSPALRFCLTGAYSFFAVGSNDEGCVSENAHRRAFICDLVQSRVFSLDSRQVLSLAHQGSVFDIDQSIIEDQVQDTGILSATGPRPIRALAPESPPPYRPHLRVAPIPLDKRRPE